MSLSVPFSESRKEIKAKIFAFWIFNSNVCYMSNKQTQANKIKLN